VRLGATWRALGELFYRHRGDPLAQTHLGASLGARAARGAISTFLTQWSRFVIQTGSTIVLARLLTPSDYGVAAMVTALVGIGDAFRNLGLQTATIRYKRVTHEQVTFFFWLQVVLGITLTLVGIGCANLIATFYHNPKLVHVTIVYSTYFAISGLLAQHLAVLTRQMRFTCLALIDVFSLAIGLTVAIVIAVLGGSYWAIVASALVALLVRLVLYWWTSGWVPGPPRRASGVAPMVRFGLNLSVTNLFGYVGQNADNVLIGHAYGSVALGLYSRAYNLLMLPVNQIQQPMARVAVPVLSYLQDQPERFRKYYETAVSAVAYLAMPLITTVAALSSEVINILLGPRWSAAAPIFQVLAIAGTLNIIRNPNSWVFTAMGHAGRQTAWALISRPIMVAGFLIGLPWGPIGVAWSYTITNLVLLVPGCAWAVKDTPLRLSDVLGAGRRALFISVVTFGVAEACHELLQSLPPLVIAAAGFVCAGIVMLASFAFWPAVRADIQTLRNVLANSGSARAAAPTPAGTSVTKEPAPAAAAPPQ
jgi:O-antigen/teichoic acid export membrane protein